MKYENKFSSRIIFLSFVLGSVICDIEHFVEDLTNNNDLNEEIGILYSAKVFISDSNRYNYIYLENKICFNEIEKFWNYFQQNLDLNQDSLIDSNELKQFIHKQIK